MISQDNISQILESGGKVIDSDGDEIGSVGQIYVDDHTGNPSWVTINTGLFGSKESLAPLVGASLEGNDVRIGYDKAKVKDAPNVAPDGHLSEQEEAELYRYYGISVDRYDSNTAGYTTGASGDYASASAGLDSHRPGYDSDRTTVGRDTSGPTTDDVMARSEERLHVGTESRESGRARLRKFVAGGNVTEQQTASEEVRKEQTETDDVETRDRR